MIQFKLNSVLIDSAAVEAKLEKMKMRGLKKAGFETRADAMASMRSGFGPSSPGSPPNVHVGTLQKFILYALDPSTNSMVVGPKYLRKRSKDAAAALEKGGIATTTKGRVIRVEARPFMVPAFDRVNRQKVPAVFANSVQ